MMKDNAYILVPQVELLFDLLLHLLLNLLLNGDGDFADGVTSSWSGQGRVVRSLVKGADVVARDSSCPIMFVHLVVYEIILTSLIWFVKDLVQIVI